MVVDRTFADAIAKVWPLADLAEARVHFVGVGRSARPSWFSGEVMTILATAGRRPIRIAVPFDALALRVRRMETGIDLGPRLQADQRGEALEFLFAPLLDSLESVFGCPIEFLEARLDAHRDEETSTLRFEAKLEWEGDVLPALVDLPADLRPAFQRFLRNLDPMPLRTLQAGVSACVRLAVQHLTFEALRSLRPGDGILLPPLAGRRAYLVVAEHHLAPVHLDGDEAVLSEAPRLPLDHRESAYLQENALTNEETSMPDSGPLASVPVNLAFELGRKRLTIGEVERLSAGDRIGLSRTLDDGVDLVFGGRIIGSGRLVTVEDDLIVEIVEMLR